jgi:hypothetical protein
MFGRTLDSYVPRGCEIPITTEYRHLFNKIPENASDTLATKLFANPESTMNVSVLAPEN